MFGKEDNRRDDACRRLLEDIGWAHGYMVVIIAEARRLDLAVPPAVVLCADNWRGWHRRLARRALDPPRDEE
jgi:hypothetical protein